jgi:fructose-bisphosphate aldolase class I
MDGDFSVDVAAAVTQKVLAYQYASLAAHNVLLEGTLLKPNMCRPGEGAKTPFDPVAIARATVRVLQHTLPVAVPGVTFLSGGMGEEDATIALNEINKFEAKKPWALTFSYGRALQQSVLHVWKGKAENVVAAQKELTLRAAANGQAALGTYKGNAGGALAKASLHVAGYTY